MISKTLKPLLAVIITLRACAVATGAEGAGTLFFQQGAAVWESAAGRVVRISAPQLTVEDPQDQTRRPMQVALTRHSVSKGA